MNVNRKGYTRAIFREDRLPELLFIKTVVLFISAIVNSFESAHLLVFGSSIGFHRLCVRMYGVLDNICYIGLDDCP